MLGKLWIKVHLPFSLPKNQAKITNEYKSRHKLLIASIESLESLHLLTRNEHAAKWIWMYRSYMQWQAMILVLLELCSCPSAADAGRAWAAVENAYNDQICETSKNTTKDQSMLWAAMNRLMAKAQAIRIAQTPQSISNGIDGRQPLQTISTIKPQPIVDGTGLTQTSTMATDIALSYPPGPEPVVINPGMPGLQLNQYPDLEWPQNEFGEIWVNEQNFAKDLQAINWAGWDTGPKDFTMEDASLSTSRPGLW